MMQRGEVQTQPELRAVVLGWNKSLKASVINQILGEEAESDRFFVKSVKRQGEVNGRKIILINTPSWWKIFGLQDSPEVVKQELVCSVFLCPPGPHVFLLVIDLSLPFTDKNRISIEEHLSLFGETIWTHTIVLFSASLKEKSIEECIQVQGGDLQQILQKCGGRYHVFDNENKGYGVEDLLVKIDGVVATNNRKHFDTCQDELLEIRKKREGNEIKAKARGGMIEDKSELLRETQPSDLRVVLLGWIVSGKTSVGNTIFNAEIFEPGKTKTCKTHSGDVNNRQISVMDTPGCWKFFSAKFNPEFVRKAILQSIGEPQCSKYPHAMILVIPADTGFKDEQKRVIEEFITIFSEDVWRHTIVLFTWGDRLADISIEQHIESEGDALQWLINKCGNRYHMFDNTNRENRDQVTQLLRKIDVMVAENSLFRLDAQCTSEKQLQNIPLVLKLLGEEFNNRLTGIKNKMKQLGIDLTESIDATESIDDEGYRSGSIEKPPNLDEELIEQIKREVSRWEAIQMDGLLNISQSHASSDENVIQSSHDKVLSWFQACEKYTSASDTSSGYETGSNCSDVTEDPQNA